MDIVIRFLRSRLSKGSKGVSKVISFKCQRGRMLLFASSTLVCYYVNLNTVTVFRTENAKR